LEQFHYFTQAVSKKFTVKWVVAVSFSGGFEKVVSAEFFVDQQKISSAGAPNDILLTHSRESEVALSHFVVSFYVNPARIFTIAETR
jgi:hypothetical protein